MISNAWCILGTFWCILKKTPALQPKRWCRIWNVKADTCKLFPRTKSEAGTGPAAPCVPWVGFGSSQEQQFCTDGLWDAEGLGGDDEIRSTGHCAQSLEPQRSPGNTECLFKDDDSKQNSVLAPKKEPCHHSYQLSYASSFFSTCAFKWVGRKLKDDAAAQPSIS